MILNSLGDVFATLKKAKYGTVYIYKYSGSQKKYFIHVAGKIERSRLLRKWIRETNKQNQRLLSVAQIFNRRVVGFDSNDDIFVERKDL